MHCFKEDFCIIIFVPYLSLRDNSVDDKIPVLLPDDECLSVQWTILQLKTETLS